MLRRWPGGWVGLVVLLVGAGASADDAWEARIETHVAKVEGLVARLDQQAAAKGALSARLKALDARLAALEQKLGRPKRTEAIEESGVRERVLSSWTQAAISLEARAKGVADHGKPPPPKPPPKPPPPDPDRNKPLKHPLTWTYDKFDDETTFRAQIPTYSTGEQGFPLVLFLLAYVPGDGQPKPGTEARVHWVFVADTLDFVFDEHNELDVLCRPGDRRFVGHGLWSAKPRDEGIREFVSFPIGREVLAVVAGSSTVAFRLGVTEFFLPSDALRTFKALERELERLCGPYTPTAALPGGPPARLGGSMETSSGSGFFVTTDGYFVTNEHVVDGGTRFQIVTRTGRIEAKLVKTDAANDLAVLKAEGKFKAVAIEASSGVRLGATVATVGFPNPDLQGVLPKLSKGDISGLGGIKDDPRYFQISVPLQPGNSGGPLFDVRGNVVGVVSASLSDRAARATSGSEAENVNYAVKSDHLLTLLGSIPGLSGRLPACLTTPRTFEDVVRTVEEACARIVVN